MPIPNCIVRQPTTSGNPGRSLAGAAQRDITPHLGLPMAGYSTMGKAGNGWRGRLLARCLYLQEDKDRRVAFCVIDQLSASRYLLEVVASKTVKSCGLSVDRLVLAGTHTHKAPGNFFGNTLYDGFAQASPGFDQNYADWLASRIATCIDAAVEGAKPALVGFGCTRLWGYAWNRSLPAFLANAGGITAWMGPGCPGHGASQFVPHAENSPFAAVDPRVRTLATFDTERGKLIGALATFGCHATTVPYQADVLSADWPGDAQISLRKVLEDQLGGGIVAIGVSGGGDVTACDPAHKNDFAYFQRSEELGSAVSGAIMASLLDAQRNQSSITVDCSFFEANVADADQKCVGRAPDTRLANQWAVGVPTLGGSEESPSLLKEAEWVIEGSVNSTAFLSDPPQLPKTKGVHSALANVLQCLGQFGPSDVWPLHSVLISGHRWVTVPGEPTAWAAWHIEVAAKQERDASVTVLGWAGDYNGYFTTEREYLQQHYEGSSTLWGRNSTAYLCKAHELMAKHGLSAPVSPSTCFATPRVVRRFRPRDVKVAATSLRPWVERERGVTTVRWFMPDRIRVILGDNWFVRVETRLGTGPWEPVRKSGSAFDDVSQSIIVRWGRVEEESGLRPWIWSATFLDPATEGPRRLHVNNRGGFPGFVVNL